MLTLQHVSGDQHESTGVPSQCVKTNHGMYLPEMRLSRGDTCHCLVVSMLVRIIENLERSWLQLLCDLIVVRKHAQRPASVKSAYPPFA